MSLWHNLLIELLKKVIALKTASLSEVEVGDTIKLNDGMGLSEYQWSGYDYDTSIKGDFTVDAEVINVRKDENNIPIVEIEEPQINESKVKLNVGEIYDCYSDNENDLYLKHNDELTVNPDFRYTNIGGCTRGDNLPLWGNFGSAQNYQGWIGINLSRSYSSSEITSFEIRAAVKTPSSFTSNGRIFNDRDSMDNFKMGIESSEYKVALYCGYSGSWISATPKCDANTYYKVKFIYENGICTSYYYDFENENWIQYQQLSSYTPRITRYLSIGTRTSGNTDNVCRFNGQINLSELYIKVNDKVEFDGSQQPFITDSNIYRINGSLTEVQDKVYSGFSSSNYLYTHKNFVPDQNSWEIVIKTKFTSIGTVNRGFASPRELMSVNLYNVENSSRIKVELSSNNSSWTIGTLDTINQQNFNLNEWYWIKVKYDKNNKEYSYSLSQDGVNYILQSSLTSDLYINNTARQFLFGVDRTYSTNSNFEIDLNECYIKINNELWFDGSTARRIDYTVNGAPSFINTPNEFMGGSSKYLKCNEVLKTNTLNTWEIVGKYMFFGFRGGGIFGIDPKTFWVGTDTDRKLRLWLSTNGSSWNLCDNLVSSLTLNTYIWYYIRLLFNGTSYKVDVSTTGEFNGEEINYITKNSDAKIVFGQNSILTGSSGSWYVHQCYNPSESYAILNGVKYNIGEGTITSQFYEKTSNTSVAPITIDDAIMTNDNEILLSNSIYNSDPSKNLYAIMNYDSLDTQSTDDHSDVLVDVDQNDLDLLETEASEVTKKIARIDSAYHKFDIDYLDGYTTRVFISNKEYHPYDFPCFVKSSYPINFELIKTDDGQIYGKTFYTTTDLYYKKQRIIFNINTASNVNVSVNGVKWEFNNVTTCYVDAYQGDTIAWSAVDINSDYISQSGILNSSNPWQTPVNTRTIELVRVYKYTFNVTPNSNITYNFSGTNIYKTENNWVQVKSGSNLTYSIEKDGYVTVSDTENNITEDKTFNITLVPIDENNIIAGYDTINVNNKDNKIVLSRNNEDHLIASTENVYPSTSNYPYLYNDNKLPLDTAKNWEILTRFRYLGNGTYGLILGSSKESWYAGGLNFYVNSGLFKIDFSSTSNAYQVSGVSTGISATSGYEYKFKIGQVIEDNEWITTSQGENPILTTNGTLGGNSPACTASHQSVPAWKSFDGDTSRNDDCWWTNHGTTSTSNPCWITYYTPIAIKPTRVILMNEISTPSSGKTGVIQGSNDNSTWDDLANINVPNNDAGYKTYINIDTNNTYKYIRCYFTSSYTNSGVSFQEIYICGFPKNYAGGGTKSTFYVDYIKSDRNSTENPELVKSSDLTILPNEYKKLNSIISNGKQYIETDYKGNSNNTAILSCKLLQSGNYGLFGSPFTGATNCGLYCTFQNNSVYYNKLNNWSTKYNSINHSINDIIDYTVTDWYDDENLCIFNYNSTVGITNSTYEFYNLKIYDNSVLVRDFIPCKRLIDNELGLYDIINNKFYNNQGEDNFIEGSDCSCESSDNNAYSWKAFNSNSDSWIDSTETPSIQNPIWIKYHTPTAIRPKSFTIKNDDTLNNMKNGVIQGSTDNTNWTDLFTIENRPQTKNYSERYYVDVNDKYNYFRLLITESYSSYTVPEREYFIEKNNNLQPTLVSNFFNQSLYDDNSNGTANFIYQNGTWRLNNIAVTIANYLNIPGIVVVGSLTENNKEYSGFSNSNYINMSDSLTSNYVKEMQIKFTMSDDLTGNQFLIFGSDSDDCTSFAVINGTIYICNKRGGSSWGNYNYTTGFTVEANKTYWFKITQSGSTITPYLSEDGESWTQGTVVSRHHNFGTYIGVYRFETRGYFKGSIDINATYVKMDDDSYYFNGPAIITPVDGDYINVNYKVNNTEYPVTSTNIKQFIIDGFPFTYSTDIYTRAYTFTRDAKEYNIVNGELKYNGSYIDKKNCYVNAPLAFLNSPLSLSDHYTYGHLDLTDTKCYIDEQIYWEAERQFNVGDIVKLNRGYGLINNEWTVHNNLSQYTGDLTLNAEVISVNNDNTLTVKPLYYVKEDVNINGDVSDKSDKIYFKYWNQPGITSNSSNPNFTISASINSADAWMPFDEDQSSWQNDQHCWFMKGGAGSFSGLNAYIQIYLNNDHVNFNRIIVRNRYYYDNSLSPQAVTAGYIQVSNDGNNWITVNNWTNSNTSLGGLWDINLDYQDYYNYLRFYVTDGTTTNSGEYIGISRITLFGKMLGTAQDYDYYEGGGDDTNIDIQTQFELPTKTITINTDDDSIIDLNTYLSTKYNIKPSASYREVYIENIPGQEIVANICGIRYYINDSNPVLHLYVPILSYDKNTVTNWEYRITENGQLIEYKSGNFSTGSTGLYLRVQTFRVVTDQTNVSITYKIGGVSYPTIDGVVKTYSNTTVTYTIEKQGYSSESGSYAIPLNNLTSAYYTVNWILDPLVTLTLNSSESDSNYMLECNGFEQNSNSITTKKGMKVIDGSNIIYRDLSMDGVTITEE